MLSLRDYSYDGRGQLTQEVKTSSQNAYAISYDYDAAGNRLRMLTNEAEHTYLYNELNQLRQEDIRNAGNLKKITVTGTVSDISGIKSVTVNGMDAVLQGNNFSCANVRLTIGQNTITVSAVDNLGNSASKSVYVVYQPSTSGISEQIFYLYDENGNLVRKQKGSEVVSLSYDTKNHLMKVSGSGVDVSYAYDGEGRRSWAKEGAVTTNYLYDGLNVLLERNAQGATTTSYIRNPNALGGIGGILKGLTPSGPVPETYYHYDGLGSVTNLTNSIGTVTQSYAYDAFGNLRGLSPQGTVPAFLTKEQDKTGLIYFGARYYDPRIGRFITQDPSGMSDGPNLYTYVNNNPVNWVDPWGLKKQKDKPWWPKWSEVFSPGYGNYGGPFRTDPTFQIRPEDSMDRLFMQHDIGWSQGRGREADRILLKELYSLPSNPKNWREPPQSSWVAGSYRRFIAEPYFWWRNLSLGDENGK